MTALSEENEKLKISGAVAGQPQTNNAPAANEEELKRQIVCCMQRRQQDRKARQSKNRTCKMRSKGRKANTANDFSFDFLFFWSGNSTALVFPYSEADLISICKEKDELRAFICSYKQEGDAKLKCYYSNPRAQYQQKRAKPHKGIFTIVFWTLKLR